MINQHSHRPFPLPKSPWFMTQTWNDLLFAHWQVQPAYIRDKIPMHLDIDTFDGMAWIGILLFELTNLRARFLPPVPFARSFPEVNVRTYVTSNGKPGIYFFSLDADHRLAVLFARTLFHLPYFNAKIDVRRDGDPIQFLSKRKDIKGKQAEFKVSYEPISAPFTSKIGTIDYWLTERYRLYTTYKKELYYEDIHHKQWSLQRASANIHLNTLTSSLDIILPRTEPLLHYAKRQKVLCWPLRRSND